MLVLLLRNVILMHVSSLVTPYSGSLHVSVSKSYFMRVVKNFRKGRWTITPMEKCLKEKHQGHQGLQDPLLNIRYLTMKIFDTFPTYP
jgi:hypothetical protein